MLSEQTLSERGIRTKYITPAIESAVWNRFSQYLEGVSFTDGKIYVKGKPTARGTRKQADYILYYKPNIPIAIIETKDNQHAVGAGMMQALDYARILDIPFVSAPTTTVFCFMTARPAPMAPWKPSWPLPIFRRRPRCGHATSWPRA
ncbi:hypothetical protein MTX78_21340 [Hymenobacter tibetensis]|uniref:Uncharacterized protein n=1 Tax=Hymenobacter tibetensis TaxID=497967 RepID=A0ABY4CYQ6_9BACT|nr:hypothetical protein [Hymenobacter tibetensis]UOG74649.1 hypothetical protein MTX78_21340 [Hymenobacter tibetensis]